MQALARRRHGAGDAGLPRRRAPGARHLHRARAGRRPLADARRRALPDLQLRAARVRDQRLHPVARRALRPRERPATRSPPRCFAPGNAQAPLDVPNYNTGYWSLYDQYCESTLSYHELLTGFLANLCRADARDHAGGTRDPRPAAAPGPSGPTGTTGATGATGIDRRPRDDGRDRGDTACTAPPAARSARPARPGRPARPARAARRTPTTSSARPRAPSRADLKQPPVLTIASPRRARRATLVARVADDALEDLDVNFAVSYAGTSSRRRRCCSATAATR